MLATDFQDLYEKMVNVIDRCHERHVILKMEESAGGYRLSKKRMEFISAIPVPTDLKGMQRFLRAVLCFKTHIPNYSDLTADLDEMVHKDFYRDELFGRDLALIRPFSSTQGP